MKKAIAMKCTEEQFDAVKDKLVGCEIKHIDSDWEIYSYLTNNYNDVKNSVTNTNEYCKKDYNREVHETWNEQIFLDACGIERIIKGSELQYKYVTDDKWKDCNGNLLFRFKPTKRQELENQIKELQNELKKL